MDSGEVWEVEVEAGAGSIVEKFELLNGQAQHELLLGNQALDARHENHIDVLWYSPLAFFRMIPFDLSNSKLASLPHFPTLIPQVPLQ